jgi:hypothetical protein
VLTWPLLLWASQCLWRALEAEDSDLSAGPLVLARRAKRQLQCLDIVA